MRSRVLMYVLILLVLTMFITPVLPVYTSSYQSGDISKQIAEDYALTLIGKSPSNWYLVKRRGHGVVGFLLYNESSLDFKLVKLFEIKLRDSFSYKPYAVEDRFIFVYPHVTTHLNEENNYVIIGQPVGVNLIGPMRYGGIGVYLSFYNYRNIKLDGINASYTGGTEDINSYSDLDSFIKELNGNALLTFNTEISPSRLNVMLFTDNRYSPWGNATVNCEAMPSCNAIVSGSNWFSVWYMYNRVFKGDEPRPSPYLLFGVILTPFYNVTTWTYNPYASYFLGAGQGIAWNASCKYGNAPTSKDKYLLKWMGPGDVDELYSLNIIGRQDSLCCHLPAYYANFVPMWCLAGKDYGGETYNISGILNRVESVPQPSVSAYIPGTSYTVAYWNNKMYFYSVPVIKPHQTNSEWEPLDIYFNTTQRWNYTFPMLQPRYEKAIVPINLGDPYGLWFTSRYTMFVLDRDMRTVHIFVFNSPVDNNPSTILTPVESNKIKLKNQVAAVAYNGSNLYFIESSGTVYKVSNNGIVSIGKVGGDPVDAAIYHGYLAVLYKNRVVLYNLENLTEEYSTNFNRMYKWIVPSNHMLFLIYNNTVAVYSLIPTNVYFADGVKETVSLKVQGYHATTTSTSTVTSSTASGASTTVSSEANNKSGSLGLSSALAMIVATVIIIGVIGFYLAKK